MPIEIGAPMLVVWTLHPMVKTRKKTSKGRAFGRHYCEAAVDLNERRVVQLQNLVLFQYLGDVREELASQLSY